MACAARLAPASRVGTPASACPLGCVTRLSVIPTRAGAGARLSPSHHLILPPRGRTKSAAPDRARGPGCGIRSGYIAECGMIGACQGRRRPDCPPCFATEPSRPRITAGQSWRASRQVVGLSREVLGLSRRSEEMIESAICCFPRRSARSAAPSVSGELRPPADLANHSG